ncbi:MAG TPA: hypothetical protein VHY22_18480 [Chthoniobacteraceae bacterium]|nr:hypothetical protein [Chthoniobacteraceae bacterium]
MKPKLSQFAIRAAAFALVAMPAMASACDQCMGAKDPTLRPAVNDAIFFMLGLVACMLTAAGFFIRYLARRAAGPMPAHAELIQMMTEGPNHV